MLAVDVFVSISLRYMNRLIGKHTMIFMPNVMSDFFAFPFPVFLLPALPSFPPGISWLPVGGRHNTTYTACNAANGTSNDASDDTGSAMTSLKLTRYIERTTIGCRCVYNFAGSVSLSVMGVNCGFIGALAGVDELMMAKKCYDRVSIEYSVRADTMMRLK